MKTISYNSIDSRVSGPENRTQANTFGSLAPILYGEESESTVRLLPTPYIRETDREMNATRQTLDSNLPWIKPITKATSKKDLTASLSEDEYQATI